MGRRFFAGCVLSALLLVPARGPQAAAQPVFFSMLFPQLMPGGPLVRAMEATAGEAVFL